jgi:hypothetical protein
MNASKTSIVRYALAAILLAFGALTLFLSGSVILDLFDMRAKEGNYVDFVVWANLVASLLYLVGAFGILTRTNWPATPLLIALAILIITGIGFALYVNSGGVHEQRTFGALAFRTTLTALFFFVAYRLQPKQETHQPN